jgi:hypothetical protein
MFKASDLRSRFGPVNPDKPLYLHTPERRNIPVRGIKSGLLKSTAPMCRRCNNQRTQQHDMAWQRLADYIGARGAPLRANERIRLRKIFPGQVRSSMLGVHLYFAKALGCKLAEGKAPFDLSRLAHCILHNQPHPYLFIAISPPFRDKTRSLVNTHVQALDDKLTGKTVYATWFYCLDHLNVRVVYAEPEHQNRAGMFGTWHPSAPSKYLHVVRNPAD